MKIFKISKSRVQRYLRDMFVNSIGGGCITPQKLRNLIYKAYGMENAVYISPKCFFGSNKMHFGKGTFINYASFFDGSADIWIGENCNIGMDCRFITGTHLVENPSRRAGRYIAEPINIGNGCWIGAGVTILPGVTIGDGTVIGAGAVVTSNCENNSIYAGVPAKLIRRID